MLGYRKVRSTTAVAGSILVALVFAAAVSASSPRPSQARPVLASSLARGQPAVAIETPRWTLLRKLQSRSLKGIHRSDLAVTRDGRVRVIVETGQPAALRATVSDVGGRIERSWGDLVQVAVPRSGLAALSRSLGVDGVRPPLRMVEDAIGGEEVAASLASAWHEEGLTGKGVKVAVIDGGFQGLAARQAAGELPASVVTRDFCGGRLATATDHGTAVAEIVHEMAPEAELYLLCIDTEVDLAAAAAFAADQGVKVINHSANWFGPVRGDGTGIVGDIVARARAGGILWVNSAGNYADTHWSGTFSDANGDRIHEWSSNGDVGNSFVWPDGWEICGFLRWDEWPAGISDFDLGLFLSDGELVAASEEYQTGSQPPFEALCVTQETGADLVAFWAIGGYSVSTSPRFDLFSFSPSLQYQTAAGSIGDPGTSPAAFTVGALCWQTRQLEFYSSQGPTIDGRTKPDLAGHDSVSGATYGAFSSCPSAFAGTSASSPQVAGAAALVKQAYPGYSPDQLRQYLQANALDMGPAGADNETGAGELRLPGPPDVVAPSAEALESSGRRGKTVRLLSRVGDDRREARVVEQVLRNGRVVATIKTKGFVPALGRTKVVTAWRAPAKATGTYRHCVRATDRAGNSSPVSCAKVVLR
jgi:subtilisin family serine protease